MCAEGLCYRAPAQEIDGGQAKESTKYCHNTRYQSRSYPHHAMSSATSPKVCSHNYYKLPLLPKTQYCSVK